MKPKHEIFITALTFIISLIVTIRAFYKTTDNITITLLCFNILYTYMH